MLRVKNLLQLHKKFKGLIFYLTWWFPVILGLMERYAMHGKRNPMKS